jgi:hypothetical protein
VCVLCGARLSLLAQLAGHVQIDYPTTSDP